MPALIIVFSAISGLCTTIALTSQQNKIKQLNEKLQNVTARNERLVHGILSRPPMIEGVSV